MFFLFLTLYLPQSALSLIETTTETANAKYLMRWKEFELGTGGTAHVSVDFNSNVVLPLRIYICSPPEIKSLLEEYQSIEQICADFNSTGGCRAVLDANDGTAEQWVDGEQPQRSEWTATMTDNVMLQFYYLNCNSHQATFKVHLSLINPNGEHVGLGQIPLRFLHAVMIIVWSVVCTFILTAMVFWFVLRKRALITGLHIGLLLTSIAGILSSALSSNYWTQYSVDFAPNEAYQTLMDFGKALFVVLILLMSLLVAKGWKVVDAYHGKVAARDWRTIGLLFCVYGFTMAFYSVYGGTFFPLFMLIMCFFILVRYVHRGLQLNLFVLRHQLTIMGAVLHFNPRGSPVLHQFEAMVRCFKVLPMLMVCHLIIRLFDMTRSIHEQAEWLGVLFQSVWSVVLVIFLFVNFRVRGDAQWTPTPLAAGARTVDGVVVDVDVENAPSVGASQLSPRLPKDKNVAFKKAFFVASGRKREGGGGGSRSSSGSGGGSGGIAVSEEDGVLRMTTSLRKNPKYITLATEPWCVSPGTFVVSELEKGEEGGEQREHELMAVCDEIEMTHLAGGAGNSKHQDDLEL